MRKSQALFFILLDIKGKIRQSRLVILKEYFHKVPSLSVVLAPCHQVLDLNSFYPQCLRQSLARNRCPANGCGMNETRDPERSPDLQGGEFLLTSDSCHWPGATLSLKSSCPTELTGFEAERGLFRNPAGSLAAVTRAPWVASGD